MQQSSTFSFSGEWRQEVEKLREEQERRVKEIIKMNKEEEARVARENRERLEKVKKENKRRTEKMRHENKIRMVAVLQENALLEDKLVAKLQEQEQAVRTSNPTVREKTAPECPVSHIYVLLYACLYLDHPSISHNMR